MKIAEIRQHFDFYTQSLGFNKVERSNVISPYFNNEFNISGGHGHLMPVLYDDKKNNAPKNLSRRHLLTKSGPGGLSGRFNTLIVVEMGHLWCFWFFGNSREGCL